MIHLLRFPTRLLTLAAVLGTGARAAPPATYEGFSAGATEATSAVPASAPLHPDFALTHVLGRERLELSGRWNYLIDPIRAGFRGSGWRRSLWRDEAPPPGELVEYEWESAPALHVPGDWNSQVEELKWYDGTVWLRRRFETAVVPEQRYFLYFEAVNYHAVVFLNGQRVGEHAGGFTPFALEVTEGLREGTNSLILAVDSDHHAETVPTPNIDWWNYGGITRPVHLVSVPPTYLHDYSLRLTESGEMVGEVRLQGPEAAGAEVYLEVPALGVDQRLHTDAEGRSRFTFPAPANLERWHPDRPTLYTVVLRSEEDQLEERIGFRTIAVEGDQILLNGEPIFLRGISIHEEPIARHGTRTMSRAEALALLSEAQALGANFVRLSHYPHTEHMTRLADELGLLVWSEIPVYWNIDYTSAQALTLARQMLGELIARDRNRASTIIWSVANETPTEPVRTRFLRQLIDDARAHDPSRLISAALHATFEASVGTNTVLIDDPLGAYVDVIAFNRYEGWYGPRTPDQIDEVQWQSVFTKPLILSEFGAGALHGFAGPREDRYSEGYQAWVYERTLAMSERIPHLVGLSPWILKDFRSPRRYHPVYQDYWNRKGVIDPSGQRKAAFYVLRDYYRGLMESPEHQP